jgi:hypothetical protein
MGKYRVVFEKEDPDFPEPEGHVVFINAKNKFLAQQIVWRKYPNVEIVRIDDLSLPEFMQI